MSRIGKRPVSLPAGVTASTEGQILSVKGPKGTLQLSMRDEIAYDIGDDGIVTNNYHPYFGPNGSLGLDALVKGRLRIGGEVYAAPGGYSKPDKDVADVTPSSRYGHLYTGRFRIGVEL